jgi:prepilin-type N-terminal cleavage/methylation domain-containing protein
MRSKRAQRGFTLIELLIVIAIIMIIAAITIPKMNQQIMSAHETSAVTEIKSIHQAETQYYSQFGRYAQSLAELGPPASGAPGPQAADILPESFTAGTSNGYAFTVAASTTGYSINANPVTYGGTGRRTFYSDETLVIRGNWSQEPATKNSPVFSAPQAATAAPAAAPAAK